MMSDLYGYMEYDEPYIKCGIGRIGNKFYFVNDTPTLKYNNVIYFDKHYDTSHDMAVELLKLFVDLNEIDEIRLCY